MSSAYRTICLQHDPAIDITSDYGYKTLADAVDTLRDTEHANCDLVIGQYSYPLTAVWCPPGCRPDRNGNGHRDAKAFSEPTLNLWWRSWQLVCNPARDEIRGEPLTGDLALSLRRATVRAMTDQQCWTWDRLSRLRNMLTDVDE